MQVLTCPGCGVKLKLPEGKSGRFNCPKCAAAIVIQPLPGPAASPAPGPSMVGGSRLPPPAPPAAAEPYQLLATDLLSAPAPVDPLRMHPLLGQPIVGQTPAYGAAAEPAWASPYAPQKNVNPLLEFLKRLGIGIGIFSGVLLLLGVVGIFSEPVAMATCLIGILVAVGLIASGRIWLIVMAFQESAIQGLLVLLVPYYWMIYPAIRKGRTLQPLALIISAVAPMVLCLVMISLFFGEHQPGGRGGGARHPGISGADIAKIEAQIRESQANSPDAHVLRTVSFPTFDQIGRPIDSAEAERILAELPGYERGSFRLNAEQRVVAFQYRGGEDLATRYGLILAGKAKIFMGLQPTFSDGPLPPAVDPIAASAPPGAPFQPIAAPAAPPVAMPATIVDESNTLRTVSFQTLGQGAVDAAAAEQALAPVAGYVAGSFRFDSQNQQATLQYRGPEAAATQFGFALQQRLGMMVRLRPVFAAE